MQRSAALGSAPRVSSSYYSLTHPSASSAATRPGTGEGLLGGSGALSPGATPALGSPTVGRAVTGRAGSSSLPADPGVPPAPGRAGLPVAGLSFTGLWVADSPDDLGTFLTGMVALKRSDALGTLLDTKGIASADAILESFETLGETKYSPSAGGWAVAYRMRFLHTGYVPPAQSSSNSSGSSSSSAPGS